MDGIRNLKFYTDVLKHRRTCKKWGKEFCLQCFGGGLTQFFNWLHDNGHILVSSNWIVKDIVPLKGKKGFEKIILERVS